MGVLPRPSPRPLFSPFLWSPPLTPRVLPGRRGVGVCSCESRQTSELYGRSDSLYCTPFGGVLVVSGGPSTHRPVIRGPAHEEVRPVTKGV